MCCLRAPACSTLRTRGYRTRGVFERLLLPGLEGCLVQHPGYRRACQGGWFRLPRGVQQRLHGGPIVGVAVCFSYSIDCSPCCDFRQPKGIILKRRFAFTQLKGRIPQRRLRSHSLRADLFGDGLFRIAERHINAEMVWFATRRPACVILLLRLFGER